MLENWRTIPSWAPCHPPPTRSPVCQVFSPGPTATTSPTISWPGTIGLRHIRYDASRSRHNTTHNGFPQAAVCTSASLWQTPVARTLIRTSPSIGSFRSTSSKVSGSLTFLKMATLNFLGRDMVTFDSDELISDLEPRLDSSEFLFREFNYFYGLSIIFYSLEIMLISDNPEGSRAGTRIINFPPCSL